MSLPDTKMFKFPTSYSYPPMWSIQRTLATRNRQFERWSHLILSYCRHYRLWRLSIIDALESPLFHNSKLRKRLTIAEAKQVLDWMAGDDGGKRAEWAGNGPEKGTAWMYWRRPEEWAEVVSTWVSNLSRISIILL